MKLSTYTGVVGIEWEVKVPRDRGKTRIMLSCGETCFTPGSTETLRLGEGDVATLYSKIPGVRIRPVNSARIETRVEPDVVEEPKKAKSKK